MDGVRLNIRIPNSFIMVALTPDARMASITPDGHINSKWIDVRRTKERQMDSRSIIFIVSAIGTAAYLLIWYFKRPYR